MGPTFAAILLFGLTQCFVTAGETRSDVIIGGVTYSNVTWGTATPASVTMFHNAGVLTVPLDKLSPELQKQFNYDAQRAAAFRAAEGKKQQAGGQRLDRDATSLA